MEKAYIISCPMCGASINYVAGRLDCICSTCRITVRKEKGAQKDPHLKYAIVTDHSTYAVARDCRLVHFSYNNDSDYFFETKSPRLDAITLSKLDSLIYELNVNFSGDIKLGPQELGRRTKIVEQILSIDEDNIYGRFIKDIVATPRRKLDVYEELFRRVDALVIQDYILSYMPLDTGDDQDSVLYFKPIINYIVHTDISNTQKFNELIKLVQKNKPFRNSKPSVIEITDLEYSENITEGYRLLFSSLTKLECNQDQYLEASKVLREHFNGLYNLDIIKLFINFLIQSRIEYSKKIELITVFIEEDICQFDNFGDCYQLVYYINNVGFERFTESQMTQTALRRCMPYRNLTFEGYAVLNRFIKDSRLRFEETYRLYLRFCDTIIFKQILIQKLFYQKIFDKDDMLLFINCVGVFSRLSYKTDEKVDTLRFNEEALSRLGIKDYTESALKYHYNKIENIHKWSKLDRNKLIMEILIEKKTLLGNTFKESIYEKEIGDGATLNKSNKLRVLNIITRSAHYLSCAIAAVIILVLIFRDVLTTPNIIFIIITGLFFYFVMTFIYKKKYSLEISGVVIIGLFVVAALTSFISNINVGFALALFTLLKIPLFFLLGYLLFDPMYKLIIFKDKFIYDLLMNEERRIRLNYKF